MLESTTLQTPKTGRSRFSKALPTPPSFATENEPSLMPAHHHNTATHTHTLTQTYAPTYSYTPYRPPQNHHTPTSASTSMPKSQQQLPAPPAGLPLLKELPPIDLGPPLPVPKELENGIFDREAAMASVKPLNSPLPPLPPKTEPTLPMSIPRRRPVAAPVQAHTLGPAPAPASVPLLSPIPTLASAPSLAPSPAPATAPEIISPNPLPSPVTSLSSLLSAYNNHTSESTPRSSTNSANDTSSTKDSYPIASSNPDAEGRGTDSPTLPPDQNRQGLQSPRTQQEDLPPPPPLKDARQPQIEPAAGPQNVAPLAEGAPTEQLWRRRSVKSDKNLAVPELKLISSHGSTAASGQISTSSQVAHSGAISSHQGQGSSFSTPPVKPRVTLPKSSNAGLPGKNIRPVASRQQIKQQEEENMGQLASKLKSNGPSAGDRENSQANHGKKEAPPHQYTSAMLNPLKLLPTFTAPSSVGRLPTPDYENNENRGALANTIVSPVSPASSPELPIDANLSPASPPTANSNAARGYKPDNSSLNIPRRPIVGLPSSPAANRAQNQTGNQQFPSRTSSKARLQNGSERQEPQPKASSPEELRTVSENEPAVLNQTDKAKVNSPDLSASPEASYPGTQASQDETEETMTDHPGAALFPREWFAPLPADGVLDALPLADRHFRCVTNHRYMTANRQKYNPIACGTCGQRDRNADAHICSACHLNICANCSGNLRRCRGDLHQLLEHIKDRNSPVDEDRTVTITQANHDNEANNSGGQPMEGENLGSSPQME